MHPNFYGFTKHTRDIINENKESFDKIEDSHYKATFKHKTPQDRGGHIRIKNEIMERELRYPPLIHVRPKQNLILSKQTRLLNRILQK